jgi:hypothetical protein
MKTAKYFGPLFERLLRYLDGLPIDEEITAASSTA